MVAEDKGTRQLDYRKARDQLFTINQNKADFNILKSFTPVVMTRAGVDSAQVLR